MKIYRIGINWLRKIFKMDKKTFDEKIKSLSVFLMRERKDPLLLEESLYLSDEFFPWMSVFELSGLLWEFRFSAFFRKVLELCPNGNIEELRAMARSFYLKNMKPEDVSKQYKKICFERRQTSNENTTIKASTTP